MLPETVEIWTLRWIVTKRQIAYSILWSQRPICTIKKIRRIQLLVNLVWRPNQNWEYCKVNDKYIYSPVTKTDLLTYSTVYSDDNNNVTIQPIHIRRLKHVGKRNKVGLGKRNDEPDVSLDSSRSMFVWFWEVLTGESREALVAAIAVVSVQKSRKKCLRKYSIIDWCRLK
jgi:hypothetical protein